MAGLLRPLKMPQRSMVAITFAVLDTSGTPSLTRGSTDGTITDNGTGDYTITFTQAFEAVPQVFIQTKEADAIAYIDTANTDATKVTFNIINANDGSTAEDGSCDVLVVGTYTADEV